MKPRFHLNDPTPSDWDEVEGYIRLGMATEAVETGLKVLRKGAPDSATLYARVVDLLSIMANPTPTLKRECRYSILAAVESLPPQEQQEGWGWAMVFFSNLDMRRDGLAALKKFGTIPNHPLQVALALDLVQGHRFLALKAKLLARAKTLLACGVEPPTDDLLREAMECASRKYLR